MGNVGLEKTGLSTGKFQETGERGDLGWTKRKRGTGRVRQGQKDPSGLGDNRWKAGPTSKK